MRVLIILIIILISNFTEAKAQEKFAEQKISLQNGKEFTFKILDGFEVVPAFENLNRIRFFAKAPDGRIFVTDMQNMSDNRNGKVYTLENFDEKTGKFGKAVTYLENLRNPNSVAFHKDKFGVDWIYVAETDKLTRYRFTKHSQKPIGKARFVARFPANGRSYKFGSWHLTRTIAFSPAGKLYVSVGSSCNSCVESEEIRATVLEMDPNGGNLRKFVRGLRNAVGLKWLDGSLYATNMGVDHLGKDSPDDTFYKLKENADYGWSFCFQANGKITFDEKYKLQNLPPPNCSVVPASFAYFPAHSAPLGFDYFGDENSNGYFKDSFLVSLHGSTDRNEGRGYKIVVVDKKGKSKDFLTGFTDGKTTFGRPCDILKLSANAFLFTDDYSGVVYLVRQKT